jgi:murein DD-endopeptidase MepM/ murein hydrolase activator NlpD
MTGPSRHARDERGRHAPPDAGRRFGATTPRSADAATAPSSAANGPRTQPQPMRATFSWRPDATDFPVALIAPMVRASVTPPPELPWYLPAAEHHRRVPKRALPPVFAIVIVAGALATHAWWDDRALPGRQHPPPLVTATVAASTPQTSAPTATAAESLFGQPGAAVSPTAATPTSTPDTRNGGIEVVRATGSETLLDVAAQHGVRVVTLVWANQINDPAALLPAETPLLVPPVDGVVVKVADGDTLEGIAERFGATVDAITGLASNGVQSDADLAPGLALCVPGGELPYRAAAATHVVQPGETLDQIADWYGVSPATVAFANLLPQIEQLQVGHELVIPPAEGLYVYAAEGVTVEALAEQFGVDASVIRGFGPNALAGDQQPIAGQPIMVPGAPTPTAESQPTPADNSESVTSPSDATVIDPFAPAPVAGLRWPTHGHVTQQFSAQHNGLDVANLAGTPIVAAQAGTVTFAGWNPYGLGFVVAIDHGQGLVTWYGHLASIPAVRVGQQLTAGQLLGAMGATGNATGPQLHFIVTQDGMDQDPATTLP